METVHVRMKAYDQFPILVVVMTAAVLVILMGAVEQAASPGIAGVQAELNWHRHSSMTDDHVSESTWRGKQNALG
ncbi:hypothetical protein E2C01_006368 [Portunus trituberculatus]|uniref:Uncharacterized protein n=1 Tax=Portunus trituberculatus TaxID=210409 RepID=A0A5B7CUW6_PORTR|nr:hypothetical protein [Portunus trituberculatus]